MTRINTNIASLRGLRSLNKSTQALDTAMTRLSTGLKINSGRDNPSGLIASEGLRTQISAIEQSIKNSNRANNVIATADSALGEIGGLLTQVRGLVQEGLNTGALSQDEIEANQLQIDNALSAINRIASNTKFGSDRLIDGSKSFNTTVSSTDAAKLSDLAINEAVVGSAGQIALSANVSTAATQAGLLYGGGTLSGAVTLEVGGSRGSEVISLGNASTTANVRDAINNSTDSTGVTARLLTGHTVDLAATSSTLTSGAGTSAITFDRVATGSDATLGSTLQVELVQGAAFATSVAGDVLTITADFATGVTSDALAILVNGDATASALVAATGAGAGNVVAAAAADLAGGTDAASLVLSDTRTDTSAGAISYSIAAGGADPNVAIAVAGTAITITAGTLATLDDVAAALNANTDANALVTALSDGDSTALAGTLASTNLAADGGALTLESLAYGSDEYVNVNVLSGTFGTYGEDGAEARRDAGTDIGVTINGFEAIGRGLRATLRASNVDAALTFTQAANTVGTTASVTINGGGAVFQIGQEVSAAGQVGIGIDAINTARLGSVSGKLYELGSGAGKSLIDITRGDAQGVDVVNIIEEAINEVSTLRGRLGAVQKNVIDTNIATLGVALENISEARSQIIDTDFAEETAALTKAQVLNQAGIAVLSIANQNPQQVLQLLG
jgi:flagellin